MLGAGALVPPFSPLAGAAGAGLLVAVDGAFGLNGATFTWLYDLLPPFRAFRAPGRFSAVAGLYVCLLAGLGLQRLLGRSPGWGRKTAAAAIIAFASFELQVDLQLHRVSAEPPAIYSALPDDGQAVLFNLPAPGTTTPSISSTSTTRPSITGGCSTVRADSLRRTTLNFLTLTSTSPTRGRSTFSGAGAPTSSSCTGTSTTPITSPASWRRRNTNRGLSSSQRPRRLRDASTACTGCDDILARRMAADKQTFTGRHLVNLRLTGPGSEKDTRHHEIAIDGSRRPTCRGRARRPCPERPRARRARDRARLARAVTNLSRPPIGRASARHRRSSRLQPEQRRAAGCSRSLLTKGAADLAPLLDKANAERSNTTERLERGARRPRPARRHPQVPAHAG